MSDDVPKENDLYSSPTDLEGEGRLVGHTKGRVPRTRRGTPTATPVQKDLLANHLPLFLLRRGEGLQRGSVCVGGGASTGKCVCGRRGGLSGEGVSVSRPRKTSGTEEKGRHLTSVLRVPCPDSRSGHTVGLRGYPDGLGRSVSRRLVCPLGYPTPVGRGECLQDAPPDRYGPTVYRRLRRRPQPRGPSSPLGGGHRRAPGTHGLHTDKGVVTDVGDVSRKVLTSRATSPSLT